MEEIGDKEMIYNKIFNVNTHKRINGQIRWHFVTGIQTLIFEHTNKCTGADININILLAKTQDLR